MSTLEQVLFVLACSSTAIMIIFLIMLLFGFDTDEFDGIGTPDVDLDIDEINTDPITGIAGLKVLTLRGALVFVSIGSWVAFLLVDATGPWWGLLIGVIVGVVAAYVQALAFRATLRLESAGNIDYNNAIDKTGTVYLRIPKERTVKGKVLIVIQDRLTEVDAMTDEKEDIVPNTSIKVIELIDSTTVIVKSK